MAETKDAKKPGFMSKVARSIKDMQGEMKRVVWPSKKQTTNNTAVVLAFMVVMAIIIGLFDTGLSQIIKWVVTRS